MYIIWLVLALCCLGYYLTCALYAGFGSSFIFIWLIGAVFFGAVFGIRAAAVKGLITVPVWIVRTFVVCMTAGVLLFAVLEGLIIAGMTAKPAPDCEYVIVLGCQIRGTQITKSLKKRLDAAYDYAVANPDAILIVSGGQGPGEDISEAEAMYAYLTRRGLSQTRLIREDRSVNTDQNMRYSVEFIEDRTAKVGIVTSNFHVFRAKMLAKAKGLKDVSGIASPSDPILFVNYMVREAVGIVKDFVVGNLF